MIFFSNSKEIFNFYSIFLLDYFTPQRPKVHNVDHYNATGNGSSPKRWFLMILIKNFYYLHLASKKKKTGTPRK